MGKSTRILINSLTNCIVHDLFVCALSILCLNAYILMTVPLLFRTIGVLKNSFNLHILYYVRLAFFVYNYEESELFTVRLHIEKLSWMVFYVGSIPELSWNYVSIYILHL